MTPDEQAIAINDVRYVSFGWPEGGFGRTIVANPGERPNDVAEWEETSPGVFAGNDVIWVPCRVTITPLEVPE